MNYTTWEQIIEYLQTLPPPNNLSTGGGPDWGLARTKRFLEFLGHPEQKMQVFHVAGTSGKGSVSFLTSQILASQGLKVGLHLSPYLLDFRERFMIQNDFPEPGLLIDRFNQFNQFLTTFPEKLSYLEIITCWSFYLFAKEKVGVAVMEVGMGGRFDSTNSVDMDNKICIINQIGLDHVEFLGDTPAKIATEKAQIIQKNNPTIFIEQQFLEAEKVILEQVKIQESPFWKIQKGKDFEIIDLESGFFDYFSVSSNSKISLKLKMKGDFQIANSVVALRSVEVYFQKIAQKIDWDKIKNVLEKVQFRGRFEEMEIKKRFWILDSAHNPQKIEAFVQNLAKYYPNQKFIFFLAFSSGKDLVEMLKPILKLASSLIFSTFEMKGKSNNKKSFDLEKIRNYLEETDSQIPTFYIENSSLAFDKVLEIVDFQNEKVVATGSIYFLSEVYRVFCDIPKPALTCAW